MVNWRLVLNGGKRIIMKKSYAVLGLGKFGKSVAEELTRAGAEVLAIDINEECVNDIADMVTCAMCMDVCDVPTMKTLGLSNMDGVVVAIATNMEASVMATILAKEAGTPFVMAKALDDIHSNILKKVGADKIIIPEKEAGIRVARNIMSENYLDFIELSDRIRLVEIPVKEEWIGKTLRELRLRRNKNINIVAIKKDGDIIVDIDVDTPLKDNVTFFVLVDRSDINKLM